MSVRDATHAEEGGEALARELQEHFGLSAYECRVLLALLRAGTATNIELAQTAEVPRTSTYPVLKSLSEKALAYRLPGDGPAQWASLGPKEVLDRLEAAQLDAEEARLRRHRARTARVRDMMAEALAGAPAVSLPCVKLIPGPRLVRKAFEAMLAKAESELWMFNRPPYSWTPTIINPVVLDALARGVTTRVLYQAAQWQDPGAEAFRQAMDVYHRAGVEGRLVDEVPMKLTLVDRKVALLAVTDPGDPEGGFPTNLFIEHPGFTAFQARAFGDLWRESRPLTAPAPAGDAGPGVRP